MRNVIFIFIVALFFACNNTETNTTSSKANTAIPADEKKLRDETAKHPDSLALTENLILYFRENGNYTQAIAETNTVLLKDSLNNNFWDLKARLLSENGDTLLAIPAWEKVVFLKPLPENVITLGTIYALTKNEAAITMADGLLQSSKANAQTQAYLIKGIYYSTLGNTLKAIEMLNMSLKIDYTNLLAYREKAICLYNAQQYVEALKALELSVALNKNNEEAYYWMGRCYEKLSKKDIAIQNYQLALAIDKNYIEAKDALGKLGITN